MKYLRREVGEKNKTHIWTGTDTACRMWSTGGLNKKRKWLVEEGAFRPVCTMCLNNAASNEGESDGL